VKRRKYKPLNLYPFAFDLYPFTLNLLPLSSILEPLTYLHGMETGNEHD
jgi:hypothetical protein